MDGPEPPIGIRWNNPWNLQQEHIPWIGLFHSQLASGELRFDTLVLGIRAGVKLCYTYQARGLNTPELFIPSFSPAKAGNPTGEYVGNVCMWTGFSSNQQLDFHLAIVMIPWARAIWRQEQGLEWAVRIQDESILAGIAEAEGE